jgi:hypothetical protein
MRKVVGIAIDPAQVAVKSGGTVELVRHPCVYVACDDGSVFAHSPGREEAWVQIEPIPGTEAAEAE